MATLFQRVSLVAGGIVLLLAVIVSAMVVAKSIDELDRSFDNAERPNQVSRTLIRLLLSVSEAETAQRGFLLTGEASYLEPYEGTRATTDSLLAHLDSLVSWNGLQVERMPGLRGAVGDKLDEMNETLRLYRTDGRESALALVKTEQGAVIMDGLRLRVAEMLEEARRVRGMWATRVQDARRRAFIATAVTNLVLLVLILAGGWMLRRFLQTREKAAADLARSNERLSHAVAEREAALAHVQAMQGQLVQQEKLAGLGRLTAGVAHELKNPLNFVNNFAQLAEELAGEAQTALEAGDIDEVRALLPDLRLNTTKVSEHGRRADEIVQTMLVHARGVSGERQAVDLAEVLHRAATQGVGPEDAEHHAVDVTCDIDAGLDGAELIGIPTALSRMFLNLIENAVHAVRERAGYEVTEAYAPRVRVIARRGRDRMGRDVAVVTIADNGAGISDTALPRIFEPFYTTKAPGQGTGLGLSLAYDIAVGHGGTLAAGRSEWEGALMTVTLPLGSTDEGAAAEGDAALDGAALTDR